MDLSEALNLTRYIYKMIIIKVLLSKFSKKRTIGEYSFNSELNVFEEGVNNKHGGKKFQNVSLDGAVSGILPKLQDTHS